MSVTLSSRYCTERSLGARVWSKLMLKLQQPFFKISPAFLHNFHTYTTVYFSHPIIKVSWEQFGLFWFKAMQNRILSIIQAINKPNCWQEGPIMYLVSENELSKPNQFRCLEIHRFLIIIIVIIYIYIAQTSIWIYSVALYNIVPLNWSKTGLWLAPKTHDFAK